MFTGLIREVGQLEAARATEGGRELVIRGPGIAGELSEGASVAVNGVCLTVTEARATGFAAFAGAETLQRTTLGRRAQGTAVNLEPSVRAGQEMGGHMVQGHVDGIGKVARVVTEAETVRMAFAAPADLRAEMVAQGSVAVDGVSLTITHMDEDGFWVAIIPFTWQNTNLRELGMGAEVNIETDIIAKYVRRFVQAQAGPKGLTEEFLREHGYL
jgi:riboflavin synthase